MFVVINKALFVVSLLATVSHSDAVDLKDVGDDSNSVNCDITFLKKLIGIINNSNVSDDEEIGANVNNNNETVETNLTNFLRSLMRLLKEIKAQQYETPMDEGNNENVENVDNDTFFQSSIKKLIEILPKVRHFLQTEISSLEDLIGMTFFNITLAIALLFDDRVRRIENEIDRIRAELQPSTTDARKIDKMIQKIHFQRDEQKQIAWKMTYADNQTTLNKYKTDLTLTKITIANWTTAIELARADEQTELLKAKTDVCRFKYDQVKAIAAVREAEAAIAKRELEEIEAITDSHASSSQDDQEQRIEDATNELISAKVRASEAKEKIKLWKERSTEQQNNFERMKRVTEQLKIAAAIKAMATEFYVVIKSNVDKERLSDCYTNVIETTDLTKIEYILLNQRLQQHLNDVSR